MPSKGFLKAKTSISKQASKQAKSCQGNPKESLGVFINKLQKPKKKAQQSVYPYHNKADAYNVHFRVRITKLGLFSESSSYRNLSLEQAAIKYERGGQAQNGVNLMEFTITW